MNIKRTIPVLALLALTGVLAATAPAAPSATHTLLTIRHQTRGCHSWALNGGPYRTSQTVLIRRGSAVRVANHDLMPHKLVETSGPAVTYTHTSSGGMMGLKGTFPPSMMAHMGAETTITFAQPGVYHFTTKPGEDYMAGVKTIGEDNVLRLTVHVS